MFLQSSNTKQREILLALFNNEITNQQAIAALSNLPENPHWRQTMDIRRAVEIVTGRRFHFASNAIQAARALAT